MDKLSGSWRRVFDRFWFVPAVCVLTAVVLAQSVVAVDRWLPESLDSPWINWLYAVGIDGSRAMLSAIGGSMLGVAATAFSITISVIATASSTYGPRLVHNFMADRGNQVVLGHRGALWLAVVLVGLGLAVVVVNTLDPEGGLSAGGSAALPGLNEAVTAQTSFACALANPFEGMQIGEGVREKRMRREAPSTSSVHTPMTASARRMKSR